MAEEGREEGAESAAVGVAPMGDKEPPPPPPVSAGLDSGGTLHRVVRYLRVSTFF